MDLNEWSREEVFNYIVQKLNEQGSLSQTECGSCFYRMKNGKRCAAGWLIDDEDYKPEFEGKAISELNLIPPKHLDLVSNLQHIHDESRDLESFNSRAELYWRHEQLKARNYTTLFEAVQQP
jgi:hypothetical protein